MDEDRYSKHKYLSQLAKHAKMPIPPVAEQTEMFEAGKIAIGVEFRILNQALIDALGLKANAEMGNIDDRGISLHVYATSKDGKKERLRFDCFDNDPHYHYVNWAKSYNDHVFVDPSITDDVLGWALETIRTRLPQMLVKAGVEDGRDLVDQPLLEAILPRVKAAAYGALFNADEASVTQSAFADAEKVRMRA